IPLSSVASDVADSETDRLAPRWSPELGISGEIHEALQCSTRAVCSFRATVGPNVRLRTYCATLPRTWDGASSGVEFRATLRVGSAEGRTTSCVLNPATRWRDRRWRPLTVSLPAADAGEAIVTLETRRIDDGARPTLSAAWGSLALEWPRSS